MNIRKSKLKLSAKRLIASAGLLFIVDVIWGLVSLHGWIYFCSGVAVFYLLSYLLKMNKEAR